MKVLTTALALLLWSGGLQPAEGRLQPAIAA
jgi:hypothetical protein